MESVPAYRGVEVFRLHGLRRALELDDEGLHHPRSARSRSWLLTPYADFTHLATSPRMLWLGTRRSVYVLPRKAFVDPNGPENLVRALLARIAQSPRGGEQLARMAQIEETARSPHPVRAAWGLTVACLLVFAIQMFWGLEAFLVGEFTPGLLLDGDFWRVVTASLMHASLGHLILNLLAILVFGTFLERPLGAARTFVVMGAATLGAMVASAIVDEGSVIGASGIALGLVGGVLRLELRAADWLPAWWRIPRRLFVTVLLAEATLNVVAALSFPIIAWAAHLGGFASGYAATAALTARPGPPRVPAPRWLRGVAASIAAVAALAVGAAAREVLSGDFIARHAGRVAAMPGSSPLELNNLAWLIAVDPEHTRAQIEIALRLAERAVTETNRENPDLLDTLAEVQFQLGWTEQAVATIDEAIARSPHEAYFREQRRRFLGDRPADDRPPPPPSLWQPPTAEPPAAPRDPDPGITA